jgi:hypothetical protein
MDQDAGPVSYPASATEDVRFDIGHKMNLKRDL